MSVGKCRKQMDHVLDMKKPMECCPWQSSTRRMGPPEGTLRCQKSPSNQYFQRGSHNMVDPASSLRNRVPFAVYMLTAVMSLAGWSDPDSMNAARNSPSVSPPFVTIWSDTEIAPALSPQLKGVNRLKVKRSLYSHGHF
jgi:hypothetical protein